MSEVVLSYEPSKAVPPHLRQILRVKGLELPAEGEHRFSPEQAGILVANAPQGSIRVVSGTPAPYTPKSASLKKQERLLSERAKRIQTRPLAVLDSIQPLPTALLDACRKGGAAAAQAIGKLDAITAGNLALWARLSGRDDVARLAAERVGAVAQPDTPATVALG